MRYAILTSGSCGNSYAFYDGKTTILVDDGLTLTGLKKRLVDVDIPFESITDVFVTHMHPDHSKGLGVLYRALGGVGVHLSRQCVDSDLPLLLKLGIRESFLSIYDFGHEDIHCGDFAVHPFRTSHDSAGSAGYRITNGNASFFIMTDTGLYSEESLALAQESRVLFLESNYDEDMLSRGSYPYFLKQRIRGERGHMSNDQARIFISRLSRRPDAVYLVHLSQNNNTVEAAARLYTDSPIVPVVCERGRTYGGYDV